MKLSTQYIFGFIVLGLGTAFLLSVAWPQTLTKLRLIYCRDDLGEYYMKHRHVGLWGGALRDDTKNGCEGD